jgi:nucleoside-diphosphate-sugar epimerase
MVEMVRKRRLPTIRGDHGLLPFIHIDDVVGATIAALDRGIPGSVYDIVDDQALSFSDAVRIMAECLGAPRPRSIPAWLFRLISPYRARVLSTRLPLSNAKARAELMWRPAYPTMREGFLRTFLQAA